VYALKKVKMYMLSSKEKENALNEVRILASISDPHIVSLKEAFFDESSNSLCLIMDMAEGGDLLRKIKNAAT
jgi:NIMA (never in mitosis gene a)-related kinase